MTTFLSLVIFCVEYHRRHAPLTVLQLRVTVGGKEPEAGFEVTVNGRPYLPGTRVSLGSKEIVVGTPYAEPVRLKRFVWYGLNSLGLVALQRSEVNVTLKVEPAPDQIELHSHVGDFKSRTGLFERLPTAPYEVRLHYGEIRDVQMIPITRDLAGDLPVTAAIGSIELQSDPPDASFHLSSSQGPSWTGTFPHRIARLRAGEYRLIAQRGNYRRESIVMVGPNQTNYTAVKFVYGAARITSEPPEARVLLGGGELGRTPLTLTNVVPGKYRVQLVREGFDLQTLDLTVEEAAVATVSATLGNTRYRQAMAAAQGAIRNGNHRLAWKNLEAALEVQPNDPAVMELLPRTKAAALREQADELAGRGEFAGVDDLLDQAEKAEPNSPATEALRAKISRLRIEQEQERAVAKAVAAMQEAGRAVAANDFDRALALVVEARRLAPGHAGIPEMEEQIRRGREKWEADEPARRREQQVRERRTELTDAFARILRRERHANLFQEAVWQTGKSVAEVRAAFDALHLPAREGRLSEVVMANDHLFTLKVGGLVPLVDWGRYSRVAVCNLEPGRTEVRVKTFAYGLAEGGSGPDIDAVRGLKRLDELRTALAAALDGDMKPAPLP